MICQCSCNFNIFSAELEELDPKIVDDAYDQLGLIPRLCLRTAFDPQNLKMYKDDLHRIAKHMTLQSLEELLRKVMNWNMDDVSRKVCLIKRPKKNNVRHFFRVQPITDNVQSKIAISLRDLDGRQQIASYRSFARIPRLNGMIGPMFEGFCHGRFQKKIFIHCIPMVCLDDFHSLHPVGLLGQERMERPTAMVLKSQSYPEPGTGGIASGCSAL